MEKTVFLVIWLLLLYINGTCFFLRGFLLTRRESSLQSSPDDGVSCCLPHKYQKVIILVIDALRYDFILNDETGTGDVLPYQNNMPFLTELLENSSASLFQVCTVMYFFQLYSYQDILAVYGWSSNYNIATVERLNNRESTNIHWCWKQLCFKWTHRR